MKKIRVLIAEDHETVRQGLRALLADRADIEVVGEAANGRVAVDRACALKPDIAWFQEKRHEYYAFVYFRFWTGTRPSEAIALRCADLDLPNRRIRIRRQAEPGRGAAQGDPRRSRGRALPRRVAGGP